MPFNKERFDKHYLSLLLSWKHRLWVCSNRSFLSSRASGVIDYPLASFFLLESVDRRLRGGQGGDERGHEPLHRTANVIALSTQQYLADDVTYTEQYGIGAKLKRDHWTLLHNPQKHFVWHVWPTTTATCIRRKNDLNTRKNCKLQHRKLSLINEVYEAKYLITNGILLVSM